MASTPRITSSGGSQYTSRNTSISSASIPVGPIVIFPYYPFEPVFGVSSGRFGGLLPAIGFPRSDAYRQSGAHGQCPHQFRALGRGDEGPRQSGEPSRNTFDPVARLLIGNDLGDKLNLPKSGMLTMWVVLHQFSLNNALRLFPEWKESSLVTAFGASLDYTEDLCDARSTKRTPRIPQNGSRSRLRGNPRALGLYLVCRA